MNLILLIVLVVLLLGALPAWPYSADWGYYPSGALGTVLIIVLVSSAARKSLGLTKRRAAASSGLIS